MSSTIKLALSSLATTGIVGGGIGAFYLLRNNEENISIEKQLESEKRKLIKGNNKSEFWTIKFSTYEKEVKNKNFGVTLVSQDGNGVKAWCEQNINSKFKDQNENIYKAVKALCLVPTNREKIILKDAKEETKEGTWSSKLSSYKSEASGELLISGIDKTSVTDQNKLKDWCKKELNSDYENETQAIYKAMVKWCTEKGV